MLKAAVIGIGAAGTACAWALARGGAEVITFGWRTGSTALYSGALDCDAADPARPVTFLDPDVMLFAAALGAWVVGPNAARVATNGAFLRPARGRDFAVLDLERLAGRRVAVADVPREDHDGPLLARTLAASQWARSTRTVFEPQKLDILRTSSERRFPLFDFAALFDEPARARELVGALRAAPGAHDAWLLGPWLGTTTESCERIRQKLEFAVGETTSPPSGPAGARFENARDRLLTQLGIETRLAEVFRLEPRFSGWTVYFRRAGNSATSETLEVDSVVLATGGMVSGGLRLLPAAPNQRGFGGLALSLDAPVTFQLDGQLFDRVSSLHGIDFQARGIAALERLGVCADGPRAHGQPGLFVAGDVIANRPRTALDAARSGIAAAQAILSSARASNRPSVRP